MNPVHDENDEVLINAPQVLGMFGITDMTLWRWLHNERLGFPKPIYIQRLRYWKRAEVRRWLEQQRATRASVTAA
jgi:predicted DNA-binding transcriptional regulator AlpA